MGLNECVLHPPLLHAHVVSLSLGPCLRPRGGAGRSRSRKATRGRVHPPSLAPACKHIALKRCGTVRCCCCCCSAGWWWRQDNVFRTPRINTGGEGGMCFARARAVVAKCTGWGGAGLAFGGDDMISAARCVRHGRGRAPWPPRLSTRARCRLAVAALPPPSRLHPGVGLWG